jgi:Leucine-rich repeat (LRR) protein
MMTRLEKLYMYGNQLTGTLPSQLGLLNKLQVLTLSENQLQGSVPLQVNDLVNIKTFSIHNHLEQKTQLTGRLPSFAKSPYLEELYLDGNALTSSIPQDFLQANKNLQKLVSIGLSDNRLEGTLPEDALSKFESLNIDITGNRILGIPTSFCSSANKRSWMLGLVENYGCDAIACRPGYYNTDGRQSLDEEPCQKCTQGATYFGSKQCQEPDALDEWLTLATLYQDLGGGASTQWKNKTGWQVLDDLLKSTNLQDLEEEEDGSVLLYCDNWYGVTCENGQVKELDLSNNGLEGTIPSEIFALPALHTLNLAQNAITMDSKLGFQPLAQTSTLRYLDLSNTKLTSLLHIDQGKSLHQLWIDGISLKSLPSGIYGLTDLIRLHVGHSELKGPLPTSIGKLRKLQ